MDGMPFVLNSGEYLFVHKHFDDYLEKCYNSKDFALQQPFFDHLAFPISTPSKTKLGNTDITQS